MTYLLYLLAIISIVFSKKYELVILFQGIHIIAVIFGEYDRKKNLTFMVLSLTVFVGLSYYMSNYDGLTHYLSFIFIMYLKAKFYGVEEENRRLRNLLLKQYDQDTLSGLYTNKYVYEYLEKRLIHLDEQPLSMLMMDIDNFRRINEKLGYHYGDQVIKKVADALVDVVDPMDVIGRYGGEEFVVIVNDGDIEKTVELADKIKVAIHTLPLKQNISLTMSIGIAFYHGETADEFLVLAHDKLRQAKNLGKN